MSSALELLNKLKKLNESNVSLAAENIILTSNSLKEAKKSEFKKGERPSGDIIGTYKNFSYQQEKFNKNPLAGGNVDLTLTGSFADKLFIKSVSKSVFQFDSFDIKSKELFSKYGEDLKGINQDTFIKVWKNELHKLFINRLKQITGI